MNYFFVDAESDGFYGKFISVAVLVTNESGEEIEHFYGVVPKTEDELTDGWTAFYVLPNLGEPEKTFGLDFELLEAFWEMWLKYRDDSVVVTDATYPVKARLFSECVRNNLSERAALAPAVILDLGTLLYSRGINADADRNELSKTDLKQHNALNDVRITAKIWFNLANKANVLFELFDKDPIDNVIACLNYHFDRVVYFGSADEMTDEMQKRLKHSLEKICDITEVEFIATDGERAADGDTNADSVFTVIEEKIREERRKGVNCFLDVTGGSEDVLLSIGRLIDKTYISAYSYDFTNNSIECFKKGDSSIESVKKQERALTLKDYIFIYGGDITDCHVPLTEDEEKTVNTLWNLVDEIADYGGITENKMKCWTRFCDCIDKSLAWDIDGSTVRFNKTEAVDYYNADYYNNNSNVFYRSFEECEPITDMIEGLKRERLIDCVNYGTEAVSFKCTSNIIKRIIAKGGELLEVYVQMAGKDEYDECLQGVKISWNGGTVNNEIDVLCLEGFVPTFISCKAGTLGKDEVKIALYELETVANCLGGKNAKKALVTTTEVRYADEVRAKELGIEIVPEKIEEDGECNE